MGQPLSSAMSAKLRTVAVSRGVLPKSAARRKVAARTPLRAARGCENWRISDRSEWSHAHGVGPATKPVGHHALQLRPGSRHRKLLSRLSVPLTLALNTVSMQPNADPASTVVVTGLSNREFLELHARPGRIGLSGGITFIDKAICRAERHLDEREQWGAWSHAFLFQGQRLDGHHWVIESDLQVHRKHIQLGVQENRISKYFDEELYTNLAVLDLGLAEAQIACLLREGLELVANRARYSLRELFGTLHRPASARAARPAQPAGARKLDVLLGPCATPLPQGRP